MPLRTAGWATVELTQPLLPVPPTDGSLVVNSCFQPVHGHGHLHVYKITETHWQHRRKVLVLQIRTCVPSPARSKRGISL